MTTETVTAPNEHASGGDRWATSADREAAARETYRQRLAADERLTGSELGALYGRSGRWGRYRIAEVKRERVSGGEPRHSAGPRRKTGSGNSRMPTPNSGDGDGTTAGHGSHRGKPDPVSGSHRSGDGSHNGAGRTANHTNDAAIVAGPVVGTAGYGATASVGLAERSTGYPPRDRTPAVLAQPSPELAGRPDPSDAFPAWTRRLTVASVAVVAMAAAVTSVDHLADVARLVGTAGWKVWLLPAAIDGLASAAGLTLYRAHTMHERAGSVAWLALVLGVIASVAGNVIAVHPELVDTDTLKVAVGATPPLSLTLALHLLLEQVPNSRPGHASRTQQPTGAG